MYMKGRMFQSFSQVKIHQASLDDGEDSDAGK